TPGCVPDCASSSQPSHRVAYALEWIHVRRRLFRIAFSTGNGSDVEDSFHFRSMEFVTQTGGVSGQFQTIGRDGGRGKMRTLPSEETLVAAYWRRLARSYRKTRCRKTPKAFPVRSAPRSAATFWRSKTR